MKQLLTILTLSFPFIADSQISTPIKFTNQVKMTGIAGGAATDSVLTWDAQTGTVRKVTISSLGSSLGIITDTSTYNTGLANIGRVKKIADSLLHSDTGIVRTTGYQDIYGYKSFNGNTDFTGNFSASGGMLLSSNIRVYSPGLPAITSGGTSFVTLNQTNGRMQAVDSVTLFNETLQSVTDRDNVTNNVLQVTGMGHGKTNTLGLELDYNGYGDNRGRVFSYDRVNNIYKGLRFEGSDLVINAASGGNVGIGTTSPSYKLDVNGTGHLSGTLRVDGQLYSEGAFRLNGNQTSTGIFGVTHQFTGAIGQLNPNPVSGNMYWPSGWRGPIHGINDTVAMQRDIYDTLDALYQQGSWTPVLENFSGYTATGDYVKSGKIVVAHYRITVPSTATYTTAGNVAIMITGMPVFSSWPVGTGMLSGNNAMWGFGNSDNYQWVISHVIVVAPSFFVGEATHIGSGTSTSVVNSEVVPSSGTSVYEGTFNYTLQ